MVRDVRPLKRSMQRYAELADEHTAPNLLVDVTKFRHSMGEGVAAWRDEHIIPAYNAAGVRKFAFLFPHAAPTIRGVAATTRSCPT